MVTKESLKNGLLSYVDNEVMPHLSQTGKVLTGAFVFIFSSKFDVVVDELQNKPMFKTLQVVNDQGLIDEYILADALLYSMDKYGKLTCTIPVLGTLTFTREDVIKAKNYIGGGSNVS